MIRKEFKYRYTYKITLLRGSLAGKYYYGQHSTNSLNDGYAGSGHIIKDYYKKYTKIEHQTYIKEIIAFYNSQEELNEAEIALIGDKYETDKNCLNCKGGGEGKGFSEETRKKMSSKLKGHITGEKNPRFNRNKGTDNPMYGKHHTKEVCKRISEFRKTRTGKLSARAIPIDQLTLEGELIRSWNCATEAVKALGYKYASHVLQCLKGERNSAYGYKWRKTNKTL